MWRALLRARGHSVVLRTVLRGRRAAFGGRRAVFGGRRAAFGGRRAVFGAVVFGAVVCS